MDRTTPYAEPVRQTNRLLATTLAAIGLAGAGLGMGACLWAHSPVAASPASVEIAPPRPVPPTDAPSQRPPDIDRLLQVFNETEAQRRDDARKAADRMADLDRQAAARQQATWDAYRQMQADQQAEAQRRALDDERRRLEAARRRMAERTAALPQVTGINLWALTPTVHGPYPRTVSFSGWVTVDGPTTVRYRFVGSGGTTSPPRTLICPVAGRYAVSTPWSVSGVGMGTVTLEVLDPTPVTTTASYTAVP
jgi:hypothetical protein